MAMNDPEMGAAKPDGCVVGREGGWGGGDLGATGVEGVEAVAGGKPEAGPAGLPGRLAAVLRRAREEAGKSLGRLAEEVGCAKSYLSSIENGHRPAPGDDILARLESALGASKGQFVSLAQWERSFAAGGARVREEVERMREAGLRGKRLASLLRGAGDRGGVLDEAYRSGELKRLVDALSPGEPVRDVEPVAFGRRVPLINRVAAGLPSEYTDLSYPVGVADAYVPGGDIDDPDAFAARVVGDSMAPLYKEGDVVVFSPACPVVSGSDCFARLEPDHESTFKRVVLEQDSEGREVVRLLPLNSAYPERVLNREKIAGLYAAVAVVRKVRRESTRVGEPLPHFA
jgi:repressor LexA